jgi:hypothetical protein
MNNLLKILIIFINDDVRSCKIALETAEKSKDIAFSQGKIAGYRELLSLLKQHLELPADFIADYEITDYKLGPVNIKDLSDEEIEELYISIESLKASSGWKNVVEDVRSITNELKSFLMRNAENARDLFLTQAKSNALTCYERLFTEIKAVREHGKEELPFGSGRIDE